MPASPDPSRRRSPRVGRLRATAIYFGLLADPRPARPPSPARRRIGAALIYFGLAEERRRDGVDPEPEREPGPEWDRLFWSAAIPLWASDDVHGLWYAVYVALAVSAGVVELLRWAAKRYRRGRVDRALTVVSLWPLGALGVLAVLGDGIGGGRALTYAAAIFVVFYGAGRIMGRRGRRSTSSATLDG